MKKIAIIFLILMSISACQNKPLSCCPLTSGRIENPQTVRDYIANDKIFISYIDKCKC